jgi:hypothetical protein
MAIVAAGIVLVVIAAVAAVSLEAGRAQSRLDASEARTTELLLESAKYSEVRNVQNQIDLTTAARQLAAATEVDWRAYLVAVRASLPSDVTIQAITVGSGTPWAEYEQRSPVQPACRQPDAEPHQSDLARCSHVVDEPAHASRLRGRPPRFGDPHGNRPVRRRTGHQYQ